MATLALLAIAAAVGAQDAPSGKGSKVMFEKTCSACHTAESVASARRTRDQWQDVMEEMVSQQGAKIADDEFIRGGLPEVVVFEIRAADP